MNMPDNIRTQWLLIKTATDYLKIRIDLVAVPERKALRKLIEDTNNTIDRILGMSDDITMKQNRCTHTRNGRIDGIVVTDDNPRMFKCVNCGKRFQADVPVPRDVINALEQIYEFSRTQEQKIEPITLTDAAYICHEYARVYKKCTGGKYHEI